jgi:hypothetical protein
VTADTTSENTVDLTSVAFQYQGGAVDIELTSAAQEIGLTQSAFGYSPANQADLRNYATWLGVEPPPPPAPDGGSTDQATGDDSSTSNASTASSTSTNTSGITLAAGAAPFVVLAGANKKPAVTATGNAPQTHLLPAVRATIGRDGASSFIPPNTVAGPSVSSTLPGAVTHLAPSSTPGSLGHNSDNGKSPERTGAGAPAQPPTPWLPGFPNDPFSVGAGTSGSAPASGSGQTALAFGHYKLAAQLVIGPQMPASVLGRPVVFLDPFERPG